MEAIVEGIGESLLGADSSLRVIDWGRSGGVDRGSRCGRVGGEPVEVCRVPGRGVADIPIDPRVFVDGVTVVLHLIGFIMDCFGFSFHGFWNLDLRLDGGRAFSLPGHVRVVHPHTPVNKEIVLIVWNRTGRGVGTV